MSYNFSSFKDGARAAEEWLSREYMGVNTGRATPAILDAVRFDMYGAPTAVSHAASITVEDPRTLRVQPWDKGNIKAVEKAINEANLGLSVSVDEAGLRVSFPQLTEERRRSLVKILKDKLEEARVKVRLARDEVSRGIESKGKAGEMGEDEKFRSKDGLQKLTDEANGKLESLFKKKEKDVLGV